MALILSIETATKVCSVALHQEGKLVGYQTMHIAQSHAEWLVIMIEYLLRISSHSKKELTAIAISEGPGSYTGLRIGTATAKGLCYALGIPLIAINTLEAMAYGVNSYNFIQALLCPMIDARRMEVYCLIANALGKVLQPPHPHIVYADSFQSWLQDSKVLFFGDGAEKCKSLLSKHEHAIFLDGVYPSARHLGFLADAKFQKRNFVTLEVFEPLYLKPFQEGTRRA